MGPGSGTRPPPRRPPLGADPPVSLSELRKLRLREAPRLAQGHTAEASLSQDLNWGSRLASGAQSVRRECRCGEKRGVCRAPSAVCPSAVCLARRAGSGSTAEEGPSLVVGLAGPHRGRQSGWAGGRERGIPGGPQGAPSSTCGLREKAVALAPWVLPPACLPPCGTGNPQGRSQPIDRRGADPRDTHRTRHPEPPTPAFSCAPTPGPAGF